MKFKSKQITVEAIQYINPVTSERIKIAGVEIVTSPVLEPNPDNPSGMYGQVMVDGKSVNVCIPGDWLVVSTDHEGRALASVIGSAAFAELFEDDDGLGTDEKGDEDEMGHLDLAEMLSAMVRAAEETGDMLTVRCRNERERRAGEVSETSRITLEVETR